MILATYFFHYAFCLSWDEGSQAPNFYKNKKLSAQRYIRDDVWVYFYPQKIKYWEILFQNFTYYKLQNTKQKKSDLNKTA